MCLAFVIITTDDLSAMGFVTPALLAGAALVALPIVLHLIMRREAQQLKFPALRFVQQRRTVNQHRLRLRHLLLLALRCAIIALLAFALARPTLRGSGAAGKEGAPVATVLVFDNSLRMQYEHENQTRLQQAKELAGWLLEQLPADSPVTIVDRAGRQRGPGLGPRRGRAARRAVGAERRGAADGGCAARRHAVAAKTRRITAVKSMCSPIWRPKPGRRRRSRRVRQVARRDAGGECVS